MTIHLLRKVFDKPMALFASVSFTLMMGILYTVLDIRQPPEPYRSILAFIPAVTSLLVLRASGLSASELSLKLERISLPGLGALAATTLLLLPILGSSTSWNGCHWLPALVYAPASGISQELYFRSALLTGLAQITRNRRVALIIHAMFFVAFHLGTFLSLPSFAVSLVVFVVLFAAGCGWGWQVQSDRTVVWASLQHSLFLMLMSMFEWA